MTPWILAWKASPGPTVLASLACISSSVGQHMVAAVSFQTCSQGKPILSFPHSRQCVNVINFLINLFCKGKAKLQSSKGASGNAWLCRSFPIQSACSKVSNLNRSSLSQNGTGWMLVIPVWIFHVNFSYIGIYIKNNSAAHFL